MTEMLRTVWKLILKQNKSVVLSSSIEGGMGGAEKKLDEEEMEI
jgi:hypothetical protein